MDVIKTMCGTWKMDQNATVNMDNYFTAMKMPPDVIATIKAEKEIIYKMEIAADGVTVNVTTTFTKREPESLSFKLGEEFTSKTMGIEVKNKCWVEGGCVLGEHTFMGVTSKTKRLLKDGRLVVESEGNGSTMTHVFDKC